MAVQNATIFPISRSQQQSDFPQDPIQTAVNAVALSSMPRTFNLGSPSQSLYSESTSSAASEAGESTRPHGSQLQKRYRRESDEETVPSKKPKQSLSKDWGCKLLKAIIEEAPEKVETILQQRFPSEERKYKKMRTKRVSHQTTSLNIALKWIHLTEQTHYKTILDKYLSKDTLDVIRKSNQIDSCITYLTGRYSQRCVLIAAVASNHFAHIQTFYQNLQDNGPYFSSDLSTESLAILQTVVPKIPKTTAALVKEFPDLLAKWQK